MWLCHSRMLFERSIRAILQEMVFDAHDRAFAIFKVSCERGIYDNIKTAVETISAGNGPAIQSPLPSCAAIISSNLWPARRPGMGRRTGRELSRQFARPNVLAQAGREDPCRA